MTSNTPTQYIIAGSLIDGSGGKVQRKVYLAVENSRIISIGKMADIPANRSGQIIDLSHCTLLPALVDCSVSLALSPSVDEKIRLSSEAAAAKNRNALLEKHLQYCQGYGVLGIAANDDSDILEEYQKSPTGKEQLIDIRVAGSDGGYQKVFYTGNIEDESSPSPVSSMSYEELCKIIENRGKKKVVVVANGEQQVREALSAGCDALEQGYGMGLDEVKEMARKDILWIPGVLRARNGLDGSSGGGDIACRFSQRYVAPGKPIPGAEAYWKKRLAEQINLLQEARKLGVKIAIGSGAGSVGLLHGESIIEEMKLFVKAGYSLEETVQCATENGARFFNMHKLGSLTVGNRATFLLTRGTVMQLPRKLSLLEGVFINGTPSHTYRKNPSKAVV